MIEKCREHDDCPFFLFIGLMKAFHSTPRMAMWAELEKYGVPPNMLNVLRYFHEGMVAEVHTGDVITDNLRQRMA